MENVEDQETLYDEDIFLQRLHQAFAQETFEEGGFNIAITWVFSLTPSSVWERFPESLARVANNVLI